MTLLVFGANGQIGLDIQRQVGPDAPFLMLGRDRADLMDPSHCAEIIRKTRPAVVINVASSPDGDGAAYVVNANAPAAMAVACAERNTPFIHASTAEVFAGSGDQPWEVADQPEPKTEHGKSRLAGEEGIRAAGGPHAIMRASWLISAHRRNLLKDLLDQAEAQDQIEVASDEVGAPTPSYDFGRACLIAAERLLEDKALSGTYHYQGAPYASRADVAREIIAQAGLSCEVVEVAGVASGRPLNTRLECTRTAAALGLRQPNWRAGIGFILGDLGKRRST